ncbi:ATP-dependent zinc protease [Candidatus Woesebacteria bacterium]|nr:ATP-dependent zinc protease [Candidatus Woesebacteria bacterium]
MKISSILGLNARFQQFSYPFNPRRGKKIADSKLQTKRVLKKAGIPVPKIYKKFKNPLQVFEFDWKSLPDSFALKPSKGLGGEGIVVIKKRSKMGAWWITTQRKKVTEEDLKLHTLDILEGAYSVGNVPDVAFIQEFVGRHKTFRRYAYRGTPDIRVIVFNKVPVMAMLRLPTRESGGRANLHQGAVAVGIDIASGVTTTAVRNGQQIVYKPGTKRKLRGIKIPNWDTVLEMAISASEAINLGYLGVDVVLHPERGPMILELNAEPGLEIQLANLSGLRKRLEKVEDLSVRDAEHGAKIARALFASPLIKSKKEKSAITVGIFEEVKIKSKKGSRLIQAKIDTAAARSSIDKRVANELGLLNKENIILTRRFKSALGVQERPVIGVTFWLKGKKIKTAVGVADRTTLKRPFLIGVRDLGGFLIEPRKNE